MSEIAVAFDVPSLEEALKLDERLGPGPEYAKIGLELFCAAGRAAVRELRARGRRVFLDLKLHDIPNTVRGAARQAGELGADLLTVHATGGAAMIAAAVRGAKEGAARSANAPPEGTRVVAVTLLTSLDAFNLPPGFAHPFHREIVIANQATMAEECGAHGIVCSALELPSVTRLRKKPVLAVSPGIRPSGAGRDDQARVTTVTDAVRAGSAVLVLGRAVTQAPDPRAALGAARIERNAARVQLDQLD